ncbi:MAG TPA: oligogalacturonate lyase family protein [Asticcacaulis sp.]|nr:oligogalacturonate lyase family protein [Asticcacaulis sp.]
MRAVITASILMAVIALPAAATVGQRYPSERKIVPDAITGRPLTLLTDGKHSDSKLYPTDQQWAFDGRHIIFRSGDRATGEGGQVFAVDEKTGDIVQITGGKGVNTSSVMVSRLANKVYYLRKGEDSRTTLSVIDLTALLNDSADGKISPKGYDTVLGTLPSDFKLSGGFTIDADGKTAYLGFTDYAPTPGQPPVRGTLSPQGVEAATHTTNIPAVRLNPIAQHPGGVMAMDLATGQSKVIVRTDFNVGHLQANPFKPGELMYCKETGEDADNRMWLVNGDGSNPHPVYHEADSDWVTHEQFADADHVIFNMMGFTKLLRQRPTGLVIVSLRDGTMEDLGDVPMQDTEVPNPQWKGINSLWHNAVSYDGKYAGGDDFDGNLWLIERKTHKQTLLSTGNFMAPDHEHPSFSPDSTRILIQSGRLTQGQRLSLVVMPVGDFKKAAGK